jgi:transposase
MNIGAEILNHPYVLELNSAIQKFQEIAKTAQENLSKANEVFEFKIKELERQVAWLSNQLFGQKSERRNQLDLLDPNNPQMLLPGIREYLLSLEDPKIGTKDENPAETTVKEHIRKSNKKKIFAESVSESGLRFGPDVKVVDVPVPNAEMEGLKEGDYEIIETRETHRLCQERSQYYVKKYIQPVIKLKDTGEVKQLNVPERIIDSAQADPSILVGLVIDKCLYHQPLYRQHQRLTRSSIILSRSTLTRWCNSFIGLFEPIYNAQEESVVSSMVLSMDETPMKVGPSGNNDGKMQQSWMWFLYGDQDEVLIHNNNSRGSEVVRDLLLGRFSGTLLSDGYPVYTKICKELGLIQANCWAHARREFIESEEQEPLAAQKALVLVQKIYAQEALAPPELDKKLQHRVENIKPLVDQLFECLTPEQARLEDLPKTKYTQAVNYAISREAALRVFLTNPEVPIDNNHVERQVKPTVLGRKNYLFCWTELGAKNLAIIQSLILTCQLQEVNPWAYLMDVSERISSHPQSRVSELTPRLWKSLFGKKQVMIEAKAA